MDEGTGGVRQRCSPPTSMDQDRTAWWPSEPAWRFVNLIHELSSIACHPCAILMVRSVLNHCCMFLLSVKLKKKNLTHTKNHFQKCAWLNSNLIVWDRWLRMWTLLRCYERLKRLVFLIEVVHFAFLFRQVFQFLIDHDKRDIHIELHYICTVFNYKIELPELSLECNKFFPW
jgi:hypothetical protein